MSKTKLKTSVTKRKDGKYSSTVTVVDETGAVLSTHESTGATQEEAAQSAIQETRDSYKDLDPETGYDIGTAPVEYVPPKGGKRRPKPPPAPPKDSDGDGIPDTMDRQNDPNYEEREVTKGRNHTLWRGLDDKPRKTSDPGHKYDGKYGYPVREEVPGYKGLPGDAILNPSNFGSAVDNNTRIVLGRSRDFHSHMAAGSIDIVAGRMAPFPLASWAGPGVDPMNPDSERTNALRLAPIFKPMKFNQNYEPKSAGQIIDAEGNPAKHPGVVMDAARVYVSQMTDVDSLFGFVLNPKESPNPTIGKANPEYNKRYETPPAQKIPTSAVAASADKVRLYARQDIKIITGGKEAQYNSQGVPLRFIGGIHLIAGNGDPAAASSEPIPKGVKLAEALDKLTDIVDKTVDLLDAGIQAQMEFNTAMMNHFHQSPLLGIPTTPSIVAQAAGVKVLIDHLSRVKVGVAFIKSNMARFKLNRLNISGDNYINSRYNTTN